MANPTFSNHVLSLVREWYRQMFVETHHLAWSTPNLLTALDAVSVLNGIAALPLTDHTGRCELIRCTDIQTPRVEFEMRVAAMLGWTSSIAQNVGLSIILIGPPGIGKTTLCHILGGFDLEEEGASTRVETPRLLGGVYGGANLSPETTKISRAVWIRLHMYQSEHEERRCERDERVTAKAKQRPHNMRDWENLDFHPNVLPVYVGSSALTSALAIYRAIVAEARLWEGIRKVSTWYEGSARHVQITDNRWRVHSYDRDPYRACAPSTR